MKDKAYKPKKGFRDILEAYFAAAAFAEEGLFSASDEIVNSVKPHCRKGYDYDENRHLCVSHA